MFWILGAKSAWRNLTRSLMAIVSMAIAAGFLTNAISLSRGYAGMYKIDYRSVFGGEVIAYAPSFSGTAPEGDAAWQYRRMTQVANTDLLLYQPELLQKGYLTTMLGMESASFDDVKQERIEAMPSIKGVYPRYQLPAYTQGHSRIWFTPLRGRIAELDDELAKPPAELVREGRWFSEEDEGQMVAVVCTQQHYPPGQRMSGVGDILRIQVPRISERDGEVYYDFGAAQVIELRVIGVMDVFTRSFQLQVQPNRNAAATDVDYRDEGGSSWTDYFNFYACMDEIQLPFATWQKIWEMAGGGDYQVQQLSILSDNMNYLQDVVATLRSAFPEHTFFGVPELVEQAEMRMLTEDPRKALANPLIIDQVTNRPEAVQSGMAMDLRLPLTILIFINAAMVIAANLLIMVNERRTEVGILKAVGAKRIQVVIMVLAEALLISSIGAIIGFLIFRIPALFNQMLSGTSNSTLLFILLRDLLIVFGVTAGASVVFGMLPALKMARLSVQEVLQSE